MDEQITIRAGKNLCMLDGSVEIYITKTSVRDDRSRKRQVGEIKFVDAPDCKFAVISPALTIPLETAQQLMDEIWNCGIRPTNHGSPGEMDAISYHLEDMRKLVFKGK